ncbi:calcium-binding protein, partial [Dolichospermum sp. ST_sed7]|nr:calcium-binding protein [Dolichospermum sp. ST_sed7]
SNNAITGNSGNNINILNGGLGADTLDGATGIDTASYANASAAVTVNLALTTAQTGGEATGDVLLNIENLLGSNFNDTLSGNTGNNILDGGFGNDSLTGGTGNDIYIVDSVDDLVTETSTLATEIDTVQASVSYILNANVENLLLLGTGNINGTGNSSNNAITGNSGNNINILNGGLGADTLTGGIGNDTYLVDNTGDIVTETSTLATEIDTVQASISYILNANVKNLLILGTGNINGTGNSLNNNITGNSGNNTLIGGLGADTLNGATGIDTASYANAAAAVTVNLALTTAQTGGEATGDILLNIENLLGSNFNDTLSGNSGNNTLIGGLGADTLNGATGNDALTGGLGTDQFFFGNGAVFTSTAFGVDTITDFLPGTDKLVLSRTSFNALVSVSGSNLQSSEFTQINTDTNELSVVGGSTAKIVYNLATGNLFYNPDGNVTGLTNGGLLAGIIGNPTLGASDLLIS